MRVGSGLVFSLFLELLVTFGDLIVEELDFKGEAGVVRMLQIAFEERVSLCLYLFAFCFPIH